MITSRFAPSPTGYLHIGSVRTALYAWLYARRHQGKFVLRIEDTDRERSTDEAIQIILDGMEWLGLNYDEGPYYQTKHLDRYKAVIQQLLDGGHAYRCYCTKARLEQMRAEQMEKKQRPQYDRHCRDLNRHDDNEPYVIRFKNPLSGDVTFEDLVKKTITISNEELDDLVLARSDGIPTYNLSVIVDDMDMEITHVVRGDDHVNNTPRQINLLKALGKEPPQYAHIPMILGPDGKKLSKRSGAASVLDYKEEGYLAEALINYLVRLGWSHGDQEIFSREDMIRHFDLAHVHHSAAALNPEKLLWLNHHYMMENPLDDICARAKPFFDAMNIDTNDGPDFSTVIDCMRDRCKTLKELAEKSRFFYGDIEYNEKAAAKFLTDDSKKILKHVHDKLEKLSDWNKEAIHAVIHNTAETLDVKLGKIGQPLRVAVTGDTSSPSLDVTLHLIGQNRTLERLRNIVV